MNVRGLFFLVSIGPVALALCLAAGCGGGDGGGRTINWTTYKVADSMTNRLAMTEIVQQVATNHSLIVDTNERMATISAPASTNGLVFAAYRSEAGDITLQSHAVVTVLSSKQVWIDLEEPKNGKEPTKEYLAIKEAVTAQCVQSFGKHVDIFSIDRE